MIKLTYRQLLMATSARPGEQSPYERFLGLRKTVQAAWANRQVPEAVQVRMANFITERDDLIKDLGGVLNSDGLGYTWPKDNESEASVAVNKLLDKIIDLPGYPVRLEDLLDGGLFELDFKALEPFLDNL